MLLPVGADNAGGFQAEEHMKELNEKEKAGLNKQLNASIDALKALEDVFLVDLVDCMETLGSKDLVKDLKSSFKRGHVDGDIFLGALDSVVKEWKVLNKIVDKAVKDASKTEKKLNKQLGNC